MPVRKAAQAEEKIGIHGVCTTAGATEVASSRAARSEVEKAFTVHDTPTRPVGETGGHGSYMILYRLRDVTRSGDRPLDSRMDQ